MIKERTINNIGRLKTASRSKTLSYSDYKRVFIPILFLMLLMFINHITSSTYYTKAQNNYTLENELIKLQKENSLLEAKISNLINIKEIQIKAENLGFVYNNSINYLK